MAWRWLGGAHVNHHGDTLESAQNHSFRFGSVAETGSDGCGAMDAPQWRRMPIATPHEQKIAARMFQDRPSDVHCDDLDDRVEHGGKLAAMRKVQKLGEVLPTYAVEENEFLPWLQMDDALCFMALFGEILKLKRRSLCSGTPPTRK